MLIKYYHPPPHVNPYRTALPGWAHLQGVVPDRVNRDGERPRETRHCSNQE